MYLGSMDPKERVLRPAIFKENLPASLILFLSLIPPGSRIRSNEEPIPSSFYS